MQLKLLAGTVAIGFAAAVLAGSAAAKVPESNPARSVSKYLTPSTVSAACRSDARRRSACALISRFFRAMNSGEFASACSLLGEVLRSETYGMSCPRFLALGLPEPMPWGIAGARRTGSGVAVVVTLGQSELDHIRMRRHLALVGPEHGTLRILETRLVQ
ncbi:MAG TPA: hypothetical protein VIG93_08580 [Gaiellaceae bacterium]